LAFAAAVCAARSTHTMSFFQRVLSYVANELLVNRLANKCVTQRVAPLAAPTPSRSA
jgi:hypothetical protein